MAVVHQTFTTASGTSTSITLTKPTGVAVGDLLLAFFGASTLLGLTAPAGWTSAVSHPNSRAYYRIADGTEGASFTWTITGAQKWAGGISRYSGVDGASPLDGGFPTTASGGSTTTATVGSFTTSSANAMVIGGVFLTFAATGAVTPPASLTERWEVVRVDGQTVRSEHASAIQPVAGATGGKTWTYTAGGGTGYETWLGALKESNPAITVVNPAFITSTEAVFSPAVSQGMTVVPDFVASSEQVFTPALTVNTNIAPAFIASSEVVFSPVVSQGATVVANFIPSGEAVFQPSLTLPATTPARIRVTHGAAVLVTVDHEPA